MFIQVVFEIPMEKAFDYAVPAEFMDKIFLGCRVKVSFGHRKMVGYIVGISDQSEVKKTKPILEIVDEQPIFSEELLNLAQWIASYYICPLGQVLKVMLPASIKKNLQEKKAWYVTFSKKDVTFSLHENTEKKSPAQTRVLDYVHSCLEKGESSVSLDTLTNAVDCSKDVVKRMEKRGFLRLQPERVWRRPEIYQEEKSTETLILTEEQQTAKKIIFL